MLTLTVLAVFLPVLSALANGEYYAKVTASPSPTGAGLVYVSTESGLADSGIAYTSSSTATSESATSSGGKVTLYAYAKPNWGKKFTEWSFSGSGLSFNTAALRATTITATASKSNDGTQSYSVTANFADAATHAVDLCVGDEVTLSFYSALSDGSAWFVTMNGTAVAGTNEVTGSFCSVQCSSSSKTDAFNVTLKATSVTGDQPVQISVIDDNGNNYCYEVTVGAERKVKWGGSVSVTCRSAVSKTWTATSADPDTATVTPAGASAGEAVTATIAGVAVGTTTVTVANPISSGSGNQGAVYRLKTTVYGVSVTKPVSLLLGADSTGSYSYAFDSIESVSSGSQNVVAVARSGNTLTFTPRTVGSAEVVVTGKIDGQSNYTVVTFAVTVGELEAGLKSLAFDDGYIAYRGEASVTTNEGEIVFVYTNVQQSGVLQVPAGLTANMDILAVGGGGSGGSAASFGKGGGGGGAGGFVYTADRRFTEGTFYVTVGKGGTVYESAVGNQAWPGIRGGDSAITNGFGHAYVYANGGGGGGAPGASKNNALGGAGGSGGGGAYSDRVAGQGGAGTDGQGGRGGTPDELNCGGGGGGAGGNGGADQSRGDGKTSDITGAEVLYSQGGLGGRADSDAVASAGTGPGFGGDGGNGGAGGAGADGVVIVRLRELYRNIQVPVPTTNDLVTARFLWEDGKTCVPFDTAGETFYSKTDGHFHSWAEAIDRIEGTTNVVCSLDGTNTVGVGYYNFKIYLKDGYTWESEEDADYGEVKGMSYRWVVVEDWETVDASMDVTKTVWWTDKSNATIRVSSTSSPETSGGGIPNVLFLGTVCSGHGLKKETILKSLKVITQAANVKYYLTGVNQSGELDLNLSGSFAYGQSNEVDTISSRIEMNAPEHYALKRFYEILNSELITQGKTYDYIVFEFDGSRLADSYSTSPYEAAVSAKLKSYYANEQVVWVVDDCYSASSGEPYTGSDYWRPNTYYNNGSSRNMSLDPYYIGLVGMFDPSNYVENAASFDALHAVSISKNNKTYYSNPRYPIQANYSDVEALLDLLRRVIKVRPYSLSYQDRVVSPAEGLTLKSVTVEACTNEVNGAASTAEEDWVDVIKWEPSADGTGAGTVTYLDTAHASGIQGASMVVNLESNLVSVVLSNISFKVWTRYDTQVVDDGTFCTSEGATYNQKTGQYEKDPNDGEVSLSMTDGQGLSIGVEGEASTEVPWRYVAYNITGYVVDDLGEIFVGGMPYESMSFGEGRDVTVYYRGLGGYQLKSVTVDGVEVQLTEENEWSYTFTNLSADHEIVVEYEPFYGTTESEPITYVYDHSARVFPVELVDWSGDYSREVRYSLDPEAAEADWRTAAQWEAYYSKGGDGTDAGLFNVRDGQVVYYRIYAEQPGYGESFDENGWVWVNTGVGGSNTVTVTARPLVITANSFKIDQNTANANPTAYTGPWQGVTVRDGDLIGGDAVVTNQLALSCPSYEARLGQYEIELHNGSTTAAADHEHDDVTGTGNYVVYLNPGVLSVIKAPLEIDGVKQYSGLDPENPYVDTGVDRVEKVYDGVASNLTVTITSPNADASHGGFRILYSTDGTHWSAENPAFYHVGTNKVWYAVESATTFEQSSYFWVTNYNYVIITPRAVTVQAASDTKVYDGTALVNAGCSVVAGELAAGDTLTATAAGAQTEVGTSANAVGTVTISNGGESRTGDYTVTRLDGTLTVTLANIWIRNVEYDPENPPEYDPTGVGNGVESVRKTYDGVGTNIVVEVTAPVQGATVSYSTDGGSTWVSALSFTDVGGYIVHYKVEAPNYNTATGFARVDILPRAVTVTADDKQKEEGAPDPALTATVTGLAAGDSADLIAYSLARTAGEEVGVAYPITPSGEAEQGNYTVTYVPGTFTIANGTVQSIWICDHAEGRDHAFYLAVEVVRSYGAAMSAEFARKLDAAGRLQVVYAETEEALATATPQVVHLRDPSGEMEADRNRIWVKVELKPYQNAKWMRWKVIITEP